MRKGESLCTLPPLPVLCRVVRTKGTSQTNIDHKEVVQGSMRVTALGAKRCHLMHKRYYSWSSRIEYITGTTGAMWAGSGAEGLAGIDSTGAAPARPCRRLGIGCNIV